MQAENTRELPVPPASARSRNLRTWRIVGLVTLALLVLIVLLAATFPVGWARDRIERRMSDRIGAPVTIGRLSREPAFSFKPVIVAHDLRIAQPGWAGKGDLLRIAQLRLRVPVLPILLGRGFRPDGIEARGLAANLVRDARGRSNWSSDRPARSDTGRGFSQLLIPDGRFTLRDEKRHLSLTGSLRADGSGVALTGHGRFHDAPARLTLAGPAILDRDRKQPYPFTLAIASPLLDLRARGRMMGALNIRDMTLDMNARAPSLKYLDDIIQAGLFGTQPIDLRASVRHSGRDWFVDRLAGRIGRSPLIGRADILKRDGRTKIDATIDFAAFDFDDLADAQGKAEQAALEARIGERVLPNTRINLSKVGPTDGQIRFTARKLLFRTPSVFRSLKGTVRLEGKVLTLDTIEAGLTDGRMTGRLVVDHRQGAMPLLDVDLRFSDGRLGPLLNAQDKIDAPYRARLRLRGRGDTIREALGRADGRIGLAAANGYVVRLAAAVLAQDMGKTIGAALGDGESRVPLACVVVGFEARQGRLTAAPFLLDTSVARSRGTGTIDLASERIALTIGGQSRKSSGLPMIDPIVIGGTLSAPQVQLSGLGSGKRDAGTILGAVAKSIGGALGLNEKKGPAVIGTGPIDCPALSRHVLGEGG